MKPKKVSVATGRRRWNLLVVAQAGEDLLCVSFSGKSYSLNIRQATLASDHRQWRVTNESELKALFPTWSLWAPYNETDPFAWV